MTEEPQKPPPDKGRLFSSPPTPPTAGMAGGPLSTPSVPAALSATGIKTPTPPAPPQTEQSHPQSSGGLMDYIRRRTEVLERELATERTRAREAESFLRQQDALRMEVDKQLKALLEQLKQEKALRAQEEEKSSRVHWRAETIEKRLDQMNHTLADIFKDASSKRDAEDTASSKASAATADEFRILDSSLAALREDFRTLRESLGSIPSKVLLELTPQIRELFSQLPNTTQRREEDDRLLSDKLQGMISHFSQIMADRLSDMDRRLALELTKQQERSDALIRERTLMTQAIEEERHLIHQEYAKKQQAAEARFIERLTEMEKSMAGVFSSQQDFGQQAAALCEIVDKVHDLLTMPAPAKDVIITRLEEEKLDLSKALKSGSEQMRAFAMERREVERTLGESVMELTRQMEQERARYQELESRIAGLNLDSQTLHSQVELAQKSAQAEQARSASLAVERDNLIEALAAETQKLQAHFSAKADSDKAWEERIIQTERFLSAEKEKRSAAETQLAELRSQIQTLTEHMTQALREKEKVMAQAAGWQKEREEILAALRKKDEMIGMLSTTFQNMLKK